MNSIVERLLKHALPDPYDEREVMHAQLLREAAERIKELEAELNEQVAAATEYVNALTYARCELAALRQRIDDAPVVAWEYALCSPNAVLDRQASHVNWDERYQPFGRPGVDYATGAHVQKRPLISKEDLLK